MLQFPFSLVPSEELQEKFTGSLFSITTPSEVYCVPLLLYRSLHYNTSLLSHQRNCRRSSLESFPLLLPPPLHFSLVPSRLGGTAGIHNDPSYFLHAICCNYRVKWLSIEKNLIYGWVQARAGNQNLKLDRTCATCNNC